MLRCCDSFKALLENTGKRGLGVIPRSELGIRFYALQSRGCDFKEIDFLTQKHGGKGTINVLTERGIKHCPFCGEKLERLIKEHQRKFDELAIKLECFAAKP